MPRLESVDLLVRVPFAIYTDFAASHKQKRKQSPRADLISLDSPFIQEPKPAEKADASNEIEEEQQHHDFANAWDTLSAFSARGWCDGTIDTAVRRLQGLGFQRGLAVLPADQLPFEGTNQRFFLIPPPSGS